MVIPQLPNETVEAILLQFAPDPESVRTLCRFAQANSRFLAISSQPNIWQPHYAARWRRADAAREQSRKAVTAEWWVLCATRYQIERRALALFEDIMEGRDRYAAAIELAQVLGYDAWETVSHQASQVRHSRFLDGDIEVDLPTKALSRQYWGCEVLRVISRVRAIKTWKAVARPLEGEVSFEHALACLSGFFGEDIDKISEEFDRLAQNCQAYITSLDLPKTADLIENTIVQICTWMRREGFVRTDDTEGYSLLIHFPHRVLFNQQPTLPMSLVYVFVCIARRLGLDAFPVAFPKKVLAVVLPPAGERIYVDVFDSATRPILSLSSDLPAMLQSLGIDPTTLAQWTAPAGTKDMLQRAAANILNSLSDETTWSRRTHMTAHYAAYCAMLIITRNTHLVRALCVGGVGGPLDHTVVLRGALRPGLPCLTREDLDRLLAKHTEPKEGAPRSAGRRDVRHFIGMVFRHKIYTSIGLIKGWDYRCESPCEWISTKATGEPPRGLEQPFYSSVTMDGHRRYFGEEHIEPLGRPTVSDIRGLIQANRDIGRWFDGVEFTETGAGRFIMSPESQLFYPDDDAAGRAFLAEHS